MPGVFRFWVRRWWHRGRRPCGRGSEASSRESQPRGASAPCCHDASLPRCPRRTSEENPARQGGIATSRKNAEGNSKNPVGLSESPMGLSEFPMGLFKSPMGLSRSSMGDCKSPNVFSEFPMGISRFTMGNRPSSMGDCEFPVGIAQFTVGISPSITGLRSRSMTTARQHQAHARQRRADGGLCLSPEVRGEHRGATRRGGGVGEKTFELNGLEELEVKRHRVTCRRAPKQGGRLKVGTTSDDRLQWCRAHLG